LLVEINLCIRRFLKAISTSKDNKGISDIIYKDIIHDFKKYLFKNGDLDILLSGTIPPNPGELLSSKTFGNLINNLKEIYDYIIIDSAPCLLVSDTFEISR
jgi:Mrp family chromosome partitioning ATPase